MTYGDSGGEEPPLAGSEGDLPARAIAEEKGQVGTLFGDLLGLFASFLVGLYEVSCRSFSPLKIYVLVSLTTPVLWFSGLVQTLYRSSGKSRSCTHGDEASELFSVVARW